MTLFTIEKKKYIYMYILFRKQSKSWVIGTYTLYLYYPKDKQLLYQIKKS